VIWNWEFGFWFGEYDFFGQADNPDRTALAEFILRNEGLRSTAYHWGTFIEA
jgi:hypothetical protein